MWSRLTHKVVEGLILSLPGGSLDTEESGNGKSNWESEHPAVSGTLNDWAHKWEA